MPLWTVFFIALAWTFAGFFIGRALGRVEMRREVERFYRRTDLYHCSSTDDGEE